MMQAGTKKVKQAVSILPEKDYNESNKEKETTSMVKIHSKC